MNSEKWAVNSEQWKTLEVNSEKQILRSKQWEMNFEKWTVNSEQWKMNNKKGKIYATSEKWTGIR